MSPSDDSLISIIIAAITLVISLAWNEAFTSFFQRAPPYLKKYGPWVYAIFVTLLGLGVVYSIKTYNNINNSDDNEDNK